MVRRSLPLVVALFATGCGGNNPQPPAAPQPGMPVVPASPVPSADGESDTVRKYKQRVKELGEAAEAGRISLIQELIKAGADVNDKDDAGRTALHKAAAKGHQGACVALLAHGADSGEGDADGVTPLMLAAANGHERVVELMTGPLLIEQAASEMLKESAKQVIGDPKSFLNRLDVLSRGAKQKADKLGQTAVHKAAAGGHAGCVYALVGETAYTAPEVLSQLDRAGRTPLMLAAANGHADVIGQYRDRPNIAVPLAVKSPDGKTAFDLARDNNNPAVLKSLEVFRPLADAAGGNTAALEAAYKADPTKFDGTTVLIFAVRNKDLTTLTKVLELYSARTPEEKVALLRHSPRWAQSPLFIAVCREWVEGVLAMADTKWLGEPSVFEAAVKRKLENESDLLGDYVAKEYPNTRAVIDKALSRGKK